MLIPLYPTTLLSLQLRSLVLHILPLPILNHITHTFLYRVVTPIIISSLQTKDISVNTQCIINCFSLQPMPASDQWVCAYNDDPVTKVLLDRLSVSAPLDTLTNFHLPTAYRTVITRNLLGIIEDMLVYYEPIATVTNHICRIVVPIFLRRIIFDPMHATPVVGHMGEYKTLYCIKLRFI